MVLMRTGCPGPCLSPEQTCSQMPRLARLTPAPASLRKHCSTTVHRSRSTPSLLSSFTDIVHYSLKPPKPVFLALPAPRYSAEAGAGMSRAKRGLGFHLLAKCLLTGGPQSKVSRETGLAECGRPNSYVPTDSWIEFSGYPD